jgi:hypothetical protein
MRMGFFLSPSPKYPPQHPSFKFPEKPELPENESIAEQHQIVERKDQDPIRNMKPCTSSGIKKEMMDHRLKKHDRESRAGKHTEDEDHLRDAI